MRYWIMKNEVTSYSIDDFASDHQTIWEGVRNYQARNFMRDDMRINDQFIFWHSNGSPSGAAGIGAIIKAAYPDPTQFDSKSRYFDAKAAKAAPRWYAVDVKFIAKFSVVVPIADLRKNSQLERLPVLARGQRLSIMPIEEVAFREIMRMAKDLTSG